MASVVNGGARTVDEREGNTGMLTLGVGEARISVPWRVDAVKT